MRQSLLSLAFFKYILENICYMEHVFNVLENEMTKNSTYAETTYNRIITYLLCPLSISLTFLALLSSKCLIRLLLSVLWPCSLPFLFLHIIPMKIVVYLLRKYFNCHIKYYICVIKCCMYILDDCRGKYRAQIKGNACLLLL